MQKTAELQIGTNTRFCLNIDDIISYRITNMILALLLK